MTAMMTSSCADHEAWKANRRELRRVPWREANWRGCIGLAMVPQPGPRDRWISIGEKLFVPNEDVRWAAVVDVPSRANFPSIRLATIRSTIQRFGMPMLPPEFESAWNLNRRPRLLEPGETAKGADQLRLFNEINQLMTEFANRKREKWNHRDSEFDEIVRTDQNAQMPSKTCMPKPYIGFRRSDLRRIYFHAAPVDHSGRRHLPRPLLTAFAEALVRGLPYHAPFSGTVQNFTREKESGIIVRRIDLRRDSDGLRHVVRLPMDFEVIARRSFRAGDLLACRVGVTQRPPHGPLLYRFLRENIGSRLSFLASIWLENQVQFVSRNVVHLPAELCSLAARELSLPNSLLWEIESCISKFQEPCEAFILPPIAIRRWDRFCGTLPGEIYFNIEPVRMGILPR